MSGIDRFARIFFHAAGTAGQRTQRNVHDLSRSLLLCFFA